MTSAFMAVDEAVHRQILAQPGIGLPSPARVEELGRSALEPLLT